MSLKCSIFGHRFGEPVVERDRDESGSEVVITIRESQTCDRCGDERVVSENKEVTTLETPAETGADPPADDADGGVDVPDAADDLAAVDSAETDASGEDAGDAADAGDDAAVDPATDDATIIEESPEESIVEEAEPDEPAPTESATTPDDDDRAGDAPDDDAVILEDDSAESTTDEPEDREPGAWPDEPGDDGPEWEPPTDLVDEPTTATTEDTGPEVEPAGEAVTVSQGTFRCPECGFSTPVESSSLREGDFCPDCHTGTLSHRADEE